MEDSYICLLYYVGGKIWNDVKDENTELTDINVLDRIIVEAKWKYFSVRGSRVVESFCGGVISQPKINKKSKLF